MPARSVLEAVAAALDADDDRIIAPAELAPAAASVFVSMDADRDGRLVLAEMLGWRDGLGEMAAFRGRSQAYEATLGLVFDMFDEDGDGAVDAPEHARAIRKAARLADADRDGELSMEEYRTRFMLNVALRNAMVE